MVPIPIEELEPEQKNNFCMQLEPQKSFRKYKKIYIFRQKIALIYFERK